MVGLMVIGALVSSTPVPGILLRLK